MKKIIGILLLLVIAVTGCDTDGSGATKRGAFLGGVEGIAINFADGMPPAEVYDGGNYAFDVVVELQNKGEYEVPREDVIVKLSGILPSEFSLSEGDLIKHPDDDLIATQKDANGNIRHGPKSYVTFGGLNRAESLQGNKDYPIKADVCYKYQTRAVADLCILRNNLDMTRTSICSNSGLQKVENSGSPVHVTEFMQDPRGTDKVGFSFKIKHIGSGDVFKQDTGCSPELRTDENRIWVEIDTEIGSGLSCSGLSEGTATTGYVRLYDGSFQVSCTQEVSTNSDYVTSVNVRLMYDYEVSKRANILVKHSGSD